MVHLTVCFYHVTIECGFTLKRVRDMIRTYSQTYGTDKYSQHSSIILLVWLNHWVFVYELRGCVLESSCIHSLIYFIGYSDNDVIWLLYIKLPQMIGYIKNFGSNKTMSFKVIGNRLLKSILKYEKELAVQWI